MIGKTTVMVEVEHDLRTVVATDDHEAAGYSLYESAIADMRKLVDEYDRLDGIVEGSV